MPAGVSVSGLAKGYGPVQALRGISFEARAGEIFGLLGPNGAGKTTALECILGLRAPDAGSMAVAGIDVVADASGAKRQIGALLQGATLQDKITPREALEFFASFFPAAADPPLLLEQFGLAQKADATFDSLSAGQRQRLFLALALVNQPAVIILDEPTAGLDPAARRGLHELIVDLRRRGKTVVLSTHHLEEAEQLCDQVAIIDQGRVLAAGSPAELIRRYGRLSRIEFRPGRPMRLGLAKELRGAKECRCSDNLVCIQTDDPSATIADLATALAGEGNTLLDLRLVQASLEEVFLALTGQAWRGEP